MSKIEKLSIQGIRSFGTGSGRETMQFFTPLTLIVGYNGSGKTTIIECLKYATTGEQPPNSKGGAFVHDPKLVGEKEVLAQVKLAFSSTTGAKYVVTRNLQLTVKKTTRSLKTLEGSLAINRNGERSVISTRVAQMDDLIPKELGVSTAILDYVIFCHQDESLWPMSEPAALKKQFDQIFEAMRYTKAIENLKVLRKKQGEELAKLKIHEQQDKINKEKGDRAEKRSLELQSSIEADRDHCTAITHEMDELEEKIRNTHIKANSFLNIVNDLRSKQDQLQFRESAVAELQASLEELLDDHDDHDDQRLRDSLAQYEERMARYEAEERQNRVQFAELQHHLATSRKDLSAKLADRGKHQSDKEKYERQLASRVELIREAAEQHGFRGYDGDLKDGQIKAFNDRIQKLLADKKRDLDRVQKENAKELDQATAVITDLEARKSTLTQNRAFAKQRMSAIDKRTSVLQNDVDVLDVDEGALAVLDSQFDDVDARLRKTGETIEASAFDAQIEKENERLWQLESEAERLARELMECTRLASERAQLDFRKKELTDRKRKLEALINTWKAKLDAQLGGGWAAETLESAYQDVLRRHGDSATNARQRREQAREKRQKVDYRLKTAKETHQKKLDESGRCEKKVVDVLRAIRADATIDDYSEEVRIHEEDVETYSTDISLLEALSDYYQQCHEYLQKKNKCKMCERGFDENQAVAKSRFVERLTKRIDPAKRELAKADLEKAQAGLNRLRSAKTQYETYERVVAELPGLQDEYRALEAELETHDRQLEAHDEAVAAEEEKLREVESLNKTVMNIAQGDRDLKESEALVERIMSQQLSGAATRRTADEVHELQATCNDQIRSITTCVAKLTADRQRLKDQLNGLELEKSELRNKLGAVRNQLERKKDFETQIHTLKDEQAHQRELIHKADQDLERIEPEISTARGVRDDALQRGRAKEHVIAEERDRVASSVTELKMVESDIQDYVARGGPLNLAANERAIGGLEQAIATTERDMSDLTLRTNKLRQDMDNGDRTKQNIGNNLKYRANRRQLESLRREVESLASHKAGDDYEQLREEARRLENQHSRLVAERGSVMGQMKTKDEELARLLAEWEMDYKDAARKYRASHIKVETTKAAIEDLGRYGAALDKAIMQYHGLKMEEVNRIVDELWRSTYQGTDIDTILIRSDNEAATGRRSYNYRVCMVKQDTEMDMRGRCSAGQKVLASIIIRLALAESFGVHCGLIALDEPTTNLDRDNIKSLAESLHAIIKARRAQSNFQLIVITHDEEFLRHMRCSEFCDSFFRVRRDDKQCSVISRESITRIV
ncbi:hypothetical protein SODALDRAFT_331651 [Sodiomyces alkalinus F11]|uniref:DNA repair protein RAD50 n=1 Tax=Sodiomyces alkalinus (strain CBS 110278 / VKM F-3762 / F11) TaxID=1314773 RepID=A0A3N2PYG8_SODAK|nr:hypothetical protein SODALDRAFT_331651 [Sodiomyces alkalinus F11]ROT39534.1 hypothetical protein SODALDRAFT_331651 [Sodiomyces alkalinus F11]